MEFSFLVYSKFSMKCRLYIHSYYFYSSFFCIWLDAFSLYDQLLHQTIHDDDDDDDVWFIMMIIIIIIMIIWIVYRWSSFCVI